MIVRDQRCILCSIEDQNDPARMREFPRKCCDVQKRDRIKHLKDYSSTNNLHKYIREIFLARQGKPWFSNERTLSCKNVQIRSPLKFVLPLSVCESDDFEKFWILSSDRAMEIIVSQYPMNVSASSTPRIVCRNVLDV